MPQIHPEIQRWHGDARFKALAAPQQQALIARYFDDNLAVDERYRKLPPERQQMVRSNFVTAHLPVQEPVQAPQRGVLDETVSALASGTAGVIEAGAGAAEMVLPDALGGQAAGRLRHAMQRTRASDYLKRPDYLAEGTVLEHTERLADWRWWTRSLGENIPNMAAMMIPGLGAVKGAKVLGMGANAIKWAGRAGAWSGAATIEAGYAYGQAKDEMTAEGNLTAEQIETVAALEGAAVGAVNGVLEILPFDNLFLRSAGADGIIKRIIRQAVIEGSTETAQEAVSLFVEKLGHKPDQRLRDNIGRLLESGLIGGVLGGGAGAVLGGGAEPPPPPPPPGQPAATDSGAATQPMAGTGTAAGDAAAPEVDANKEAAHKARVKQEAEAMLASVMEDPGQEEGPASGAAPTGPGSPPAPPGSGPAPAGGQGPAPQEVTPEYLAAVEASKAIDRLPPRLRGIAAEKFREEHGVYGGQIDPGEEGPASAGPAAPAPPAGPQQPPAGPTGSAVASLIGGKRVAPVRTTPPDAGAQAIADADVEGVSAEPVPVPVAVDDRRAVDRARPDRRQDLTQRRTVAEMDPEEMRTALLTDELTGLGNRRAYDEAKKRPVQAAIDIDSLKWVNDNLGHDVGDELIRLTGRALDQAGMEAYHPSGDEFWAQGDDEQVVTAELAAAEKYLQDHPITVETPDGKTITFKPGFSYGTGQDQKTADSALAGHKTEREKTGARAARGARPAGILEERAAGDQVEDRQQGGDQGVVGTEAAKPELSFEQFEKEYRAAFQNMNKYGVDQVGSGHWAEKMAELSDQYPQWAEQVENARPDQAEKVAPAAVERGQVGGKLSAGQVVLTATGRQTSPFPAIDTTTDRKAQNTVNRVDRWLLSEAVKEARARNDEFNLRQFDHDSHIKNIPQASKDSAEQYLFGDEQPPVVKSILKPLVSPSPPPAQQAAQSLAGKPSKRQKALEQYRSFVEGLSSEQRARVKDMLVDEPGSPSIQMRRIQQALAKVKPAPQGAASLTGRPSARKPSADPETIEFTVKSLASGREETMVLPAALPPAGPAYGQSNTVFTKSAADAARELLKKKLGQVNVGLDPEIVQAGIQLAGYHIEAGARSFAAYAKAMIDDLGEMVRPYLRGWYEAVRYYPGFDSAGMSSGSEIETEPADKAEKTAVETMGLRKPAKKPLTGQPESTINKVSDKEVSDGSIRRTDEGLPAGEGPGQVSADEKIRPADRVLPDEEPGGAAAEAEPGGDRDAGSHGRRDRALRADEPVDYTITESDGLGQGGAKTKFKDNVAAIRLLADLDSRPVTSEDQSILVKYVGWGGLSQAFVRPDGTVAKGWEKEAAELKQLLSPQAYASARASTQDAHYTSEAIVRSIFAAVRRIGFNAGKILEPSVGTGNFIGLMPKSMRSRSHVTGVEIDPITAKIAAYLYPKQSIVESGFEELALTPGSFDLAVGNPPFGDKKLYDARHKDLKGFSIHNYFFAKSLIGLRPNGILAMVVSSHMMDKQGGAQRAWIAERADLLGAIRLPNSAFKGNAGTEVTTDVIFLRKRLDGESSSGPAWQNLKPVAGREHTYRVNEYYAEHPDMMLGELVPNKLFPGEVKDGVYQGAPGLAAKAGTDIEAALAAAVEMLPEGIYKTGQTLEQVQQPEIIVSDVGFAQPFGYGLDDQGRAVRRLPDVNGRPFFEPALYSGKPLEGKRLARFKGLLEVRDALRRLVRAEVADESAAVLDALRSELNQVYDDFVKAHGLISTSANSSVLASDPTDLPLLRSLELNFDPGISATVAKRTGETAKEPSAQKAAIFSVRTREPYRAATAAADAKEGLAVVLRENGVVDMTRIAALVGISEQQAADDLTGIVFRDPATDSWVTKDSYLSGNVKEKLIAAKRAAADERAFAANVAALEAVIPEDVAPDLISFRLGATWMPSDIYEQFASDVLQAPVAVSYIEDVGVWSVRPEPRSTTPYDTPGMAGTEIFSRMVQSRDVVVYDTDRDGKRVFNLDHTTLARSKAEEMDRAFQEWVLSDLARRDQVARVFNDKVNTTVEARFDGSHMIFPGMGVITAGVARDDQLLSQQKNAVWRFIQKGKGLADHVVGSGKTFLSIAAGLEMRRMGLVKKPMYVVPNHLVSQWSFDFQRLYPGANILVIGKKDFAKSNRQEFLGRIATGNWDAVVIAHSSFGFIKMPRQYELRFYGDQVRQYERAIQELAAAEGGKSRSVKQMEKAKAKLQEKLKALADKPKDATVDFSELGVDALFVDEAHMFKNLFYATKRTRVAGLGNPQGSKKAFDMFVKTQFILENNNDKGVFFLTGTPVSNSISEMYTMMRYMEYGRMKKMGIRHFDQWATMFASAVSDWEVDPTGTRYRLQSKLDFVNLPGLLAFYKDFADVVSTADLQGWAKERGQVWPIPDIKGGKPENTVAERSELQKSFMAWIVNRFDHMPSDPREDNPLKATGEAMKAALDIRLINPALPDHPGSKVNLAVDKIKAIHAAWEKQKGTQLVFCDLSVPKKARGKHAAEIGALREKMRTLEARLESESNDEAALELEEEYNKVAEKFARFSPSELIAAESEFSVYDDIKQKLIASGIPESEIAFIHDANTDLQKEDLFGRVRAGRVRVLIGSTEKMGAGMNVQTKLVALHHLDAPWRPSDLEQREGRIIRQGNELYADAVRSGKKFEVEIYRYATKETLDTRRWQIIERKAKTIEALRSGGHAWGDTIADALGEATNAAEMKAASSGNPLILKEIQVRKQIEKAEAQRRAERAQRMEYERTLARAQAQESDYPGLVAGVDADKDLIEANPRDNSAQGWRIAIDDEVFAAQDLVPVPAPGSSKEDVVAAEKHNAEALKAAKDQFKAALSARLEPFFDKQSKPDAFEITLRGVTFEVAHTYGRDAVRFDPDLSGSIAYNMGMSRGADFWVTVSDGFSVDGIVARMHNRLDTVAADNAATKERLARDLARVRKDAQIARDVLAKAEAGTAEVEALRAEHASILSQLQSEAARAPQEEQDFSQWQAGSGKRSASRLASGPATASGSGYFVHLRDEGYKDAAGAKRVDLVDWLHTFVRKTGPKSWEISETVSGARLASGSTRSDAIARAIALFDKYGKEGTLDVVKKYIEENGRSPWAGQALYSLEPGRGQLSLSDVRAVFPGQDVGVSSHDPNVFWVRMKNGKGLEIARVEQIDKDQAAIGVAYGAMDQSGNLAAGKYQAGRIEISRHVGDKWTLTHESVHFLEDAGMISPADIVVLKRHIKQLAANNKWAARNKADVGGVEDRAAFVAERLQARSEVRGPVGRILQKISDLIDKLAGLFGRTAAGVVRDIESGAVFERSAGELAGLAPGSYELTAGRWYSQMQRVLADKLPGSGSVKQLRDTLDSWVKKGLIKEEELEWSGLVPWLDGQEGKITKQQVLDYLAANHVQIEEVEKGGENYRVVDNYGADVKIVGSEEEGRNYIESLGRDGVGFAVYPPSSQDDYDMQTKFSQYQTPGGENYRELLLTSPFLKTEDELSKKFPIKLLKKINGRVEGLAYAKDQTEANEMSKRFKAAGYDEVVIEKNRTYSKVEYKSPHYDEPNILAHVRFKDQTGPNGEKILFIEEEQADKGQEWQKLKKKIADGKADKTDRDRFEFLSKFPYNKTSSWVGLVMRRMVRYAAENGYDSIAWTPGDVQAERYDLSKRIKEINYEQDADGGDNYDFSATDHSGKEVIAEEDIPLSRIEELVGKEIAEKVKNGEGKDDSSAYRDWKSLTGLDLKVGGEGMKGFYDRILPAEVNKFFNKAAWGNAKVGTVNIRTVKDESMESFMDWYESQSPIKPFDAMTGEEFNAMKNEWLSEQPGKKVTAWSLPITPQMRQKALREGMPLFALVGNPQPGPAITRDLENDRTFANKLHEMADVARENVGVATAKLQTRVQELAGSASRRRLPLGFAYNRKVKESMASRRLDQAMFLYRDAGGDLSKFADFRARAQQGIDNGTIAGAHRVYVGSVLKALETAENLSAEQKEFIEEMGDRFEAAYQVAEQSKVIQSHVDNYVRRIYRRKKTDPDAAVYSGWTGGGHGFRVSHGAAKPRTYDTALDAILDGYELGVTGITSSYDSYMRELVTVMANRAFVSQGMHSTDASGRKLFTTNSNKVKGYEDYKELKAEGFSAWQLTGTVTATDYARMGRVLETNSWGRKVFISQPEYVPESWAVYAPNASRASKVFYANPLYNARDAAEQWASSRGYSDVRNRPPANTAGQFQKLKLYAPAPLADMLNKMTASDPLFASTPALQAVARLNAGVKSWVLMTSFFHHLAGARSWVFGVHHGWGAGKHMVVSADGARVLGEFRDLEQARQMATDQNGVVIERTKAAPWRAYKAGLDKVYDLHPLISKLVKHGLTLGELQDWSESALRDQGGLTERLVKHFGWDTAAGVVERFRFTREKWANSLFKKYFAGLKAEAAVIEYTHELSRAQELYAAGKAPVPDADKIAEKVARLINADFGGLHLKRMGRNPTLQLISRLMLLAPDWTESNFRTVTGMVPGLNEKISRLIGDVSPPPGMDGVYRRFWGRVALRIVLSTVLAQMLLNGKDESEEFIEEQMLSNRFNKFRWTEVDISKIFEMLGIDLEGQRKTFSIGGHFFDPLKLLDPVRLIKGKASPAMRAAGAAFSGSDWADRPFTGLAELVTTGRTVKKSAFEDTESGFNRLPATVVNQVINMQPIQVGQLLRYIQGEEDGLSALLHSAGAHVHTAWVPRGTDPIDVPAGFEAAGAEIERLKKAGALRLGPASRKLTIAGMPVAMSAAQYADYVARFSATAANKIQTMMGFAGYKAWDDDRRAAKIAAVIENARGRARKKVRREVRLAN